MGEDMMEGEMEGEETSGYQKEIKFDAPEGFEIPEGVKPGDTFEAMASFRLKDNGQICLEGVEGNMLPGEKGEMSGEESSEGAEEYGGSKKSPKRGKGGPAFGFLMAIEKGASKKGK